MATELLRPYEPSECGKDGYPLAWHKGEPSIKDLVRDLSGHRCVRCLHPYRAGESGNGEWSPCDERCDHAGPFRGWSAGSPCWHDEYANPNSARHYIVDKGYQRLDARWRILTVHHLTGEKADCRWWNLAALCQRCHLQIQGRVHMEQVYPYEHSEWFKPYAAGYYALTYLGEELSREETVDRLDELLELESPPTPNTEAATASEGAR
jgi:hypothetical protein